MLHLRTLSWGRLLPVKFLGGVAGIGMGLSLGREGPTVQIGAAVAQALSRPLRTPRSDIPQLLSAGAGAGLAAAFNAPLAGLVFVVEELHRELSSRTAAGALIAAVCATVVTQWLAGDTPSFAAHGLTSMSLTALPLAAIIGVFGGCGGVVFNQAILAGQAAEGLRGPPIYDALLQADLRRSGFGPPGTELPPSTRWATPCPPPMASGNHRYPVTVRGGRQADRRRGASARVPHRRPGARRKRAAAGGRHGAPSR